MRQYCVFWLNVIAGITMCVVPGEGKMSYSTSTQQLYYKICANNSLAKRLSLVFHTCSNSKDSSGLVELKNMH